MSGFRVNVVARNPKQEEVSTPPIEALVDTGSELTWLPADILHAAGITRRRTRTFATATQQKVEREVGFAVLEAEGYQTVDEVVFAQPGDMILLGVRTIEGFGVAVDNIAHRFVATTTIVATMPTRPSRRVFAGRFRRPRTGPRPQPGRRRMGHPDHLRESLTM